MGAHNNNNNNNNGSDGDNHHPHATQLTKQTTKQKPRPGQGPGRNMLINPDYDTNTKALIAAVILHAKWETVNGSQAQRAAAREWLLSEGQTWIDAIADVHPDKIRRWLDGTKPARRDRWKSYQKPQIV